LPAIEPPLQDPSVLGTGGQGSGYLDALSKAPAHKRMVQILDGVREANGNEPFLAMVAGDAMAYDYGGDALCRVVCQDVGPEPGLCSKNRGGHHREVRGSDGYMYAGLRRLMCFLT
jgi:hypothetical protein